MMSKRIHCQMKESAGLQYIYVVSVLENLEGNCWFKELNMLVYKNQKVEGGGKQTHTGL